jgi:Lon protease-like protein
MTDFPEPAAALADFPGIAPLFPLPNVVLFPHGLLPLHIFEARYRQMTADALAGDGFLAVALLKTPAGSEDPPAIWPMVGLGRIVAHEQLSDGRYYLLVRGLTRARVLYECETKKLYRIGRLELCPDREPQPAAATRWSRRLLQRFGALFPGVKEHELWTQVTGSPLPLGVLCDLLASSLPLRPELAQKFLDEVHVQTRCRLLWEVLNLTEMSLQPAQRRSFPPTFSNN